MKIAAAFLLAGLSTALNAGAWGKAPVEECVGLGGNIAVGYH